MALITVDYFNDGVKNIPNIDKPSVTEMVTDMIARLELEYLQGVLGYALAKAFADGLAVEPEPETRWIALRDGAEYLRDGRLLKWNGFVDAVTYRSPIANYVMANYVNEKSQITTGVGEASPKAEYSDKESPTMKYLANWNRMTADNLAVIDYVISSGLYPEYDANALSPRFFYPVNYLGI
jgi:hypothetical protein